MDSICHTYHKYLQIKHLHIHKPHCDINIAEQSIKYRIDDIYSILIKMK